MLKKIIKIIKKKIGDVDADRDLQFLASLKNKHAGMTCVVIGNGPSLKIADLNRLKNVVTFASNKIYLAFDETDWRPTYYTIVDLIVAKNNAEVIKKLKLTKILSDQTTSVFKDRNAYYFKELMVTIPDCENPYPFSRNIVHGVNAGHTVIYNQLQLAWYMGFTQVFLIGVDYNFEIPKKTKKDNDYEEVFVNQTEQNHFHPQYRKPGETWAKPNLVGQYNAFKMADKIFNESGRKIFNASRFSKLDVFEMVNFDDFF